MQSTSSWICAGLVFLTSACASTHAGLAALAHRGMFRVHAQDPATAERVLAECEAAAKAVLANPTCGPAVPLELWCVPVEAQFGEGRNVFDGTPETGRLLGIEIDIGRELAWERFTIGHELGHAWLAPSLRALPQVLEEGLADQCGERADPEAGVWRRLEHALSLGTWAGVGVPYQFQVGSGIESGTLYVARGASMDLRLASMLELDGTSYHHVGTDEDMLLLYGVGYVLASELDLARLTALCARAEREGCATVPAAWVLEAVGVPLDTGAEWGERGARLIGAAEREALLQHVHHEGRFRRDG